MSKKVVIGIIIIVILGAGYWWWSNRAVTPSEGNTAAETNVAPGNGGDKITTQACGSDLACGNRLLAACQPTVFTAQGGAMTVETAVLGKKGLLCEISSTIALSQLAGFADASLDKNGDGKLSMNCAVEMGLNFDGLTKALKGSGLQKCTGELRAFYDSL